MSYYKSFFQSCIGLLFDYIDALPVDDISTSVVSVVNRSYATVYRYVYCLPPPTLRQWSDFKSCPQVPNLLQKTERGSVCCFIAFE